MTILCNVQLVTDFDVIGADAPDARWYLNLDSKTLIYERRPEVSNPFEALEPSPRTPNLIENPRQLFFLADESHPVEFYATQHKRSFRLLPPSDEASCHYWHLMDGSDTCPSAAVCPYRAQIVRFQPAATGMPLPRGGISLEVVKERPIKSDKEPEPVWNLFPLHDTGLDRRCVDWVESRARGLHSLPPVAAPLGSSDYFGRFPSRLRQLLLTQRIGDKRLRSDHLVSASDLPGVREAGVLRLLDSLDLKDSFPPVRNGTPTPINRTLIVRLRRPALPNHPVAAWKRLYGEPEQTLEHAATIWVRQWLRSQLSECADDVEWQVDPRLPHSFDPVEPDRDHYASEALNSDLGDSLRRVLGTLAKAPDAPWMLLTFAAEFLSVNVQNPSDHTAAGLAALGGKQTAESIHDGFVALLGYTDTAPPRETVKASLFRYVLGWVPGHFLRPPGFSPWPGQLLDWWLAASPNPERTAVGKTDVDTAILITATAASEPVRVANSRLGRSSPRRFVLGRSKLAAPESRAMPPHPLGPSDWARVIALLGKRSG